MTPLKYQRNLRKSNVCERSFKGRSDNFWWPFMRLRREIFEEIIVDEYNRIKPLEARQLYLDVCTLNRLGSECVLGSCFA